MIGARYAALFETGQYGRLYFVSGRHARGKTFHVYLLPSDAQIEGNPWGRKDVVEVYGVVGGHPGWTEHYGWLHKGAWQQDFYSLVEEREAEIAAQKKEMESLAASELEAESQRVERLLADYK